LYTKIEKKLLKTFKNLTKNLKTFSKTRRFFAALVANSDRSVQPVVATGYSDDCTMYAPCVTEPVPIILWITNLFLQ